MNGYGSHTFKMVNAKDEAVYVKFHYKSDQGIKTFNRQEVHIFIFFYFYHFFWDGAGHFKETFRKISYQVI